MTWRSFDRLARPYRWMEYLSFGRALERCRFRFLPELSGTQHALLLGDGDGRFADRLLRTAPSVQVHAVDASAAMLGTLERRCAEAEGTHRVTTSQGYLPGCLSKLPQVEAFDLVTTHFLLDCLSEGDVLDLARLVKPLLRSDAVWVVSEFNIPAGNMRLPAQLLVGSLYFGFRLLTGLRTRRLPDHAAMLKRQGFRRARQVRSFCGILVSEIWVVAET